jgi:hypothetical protein
MKNIKILSILFTITAMLFVSCDKDFEEINSDPNNPVTVPSSLLLPGVVRTAANFNYEPGYGVDMGACWSQHMAKVQYNSEARYYPRAGVVKNYWNSYYASVIKDAQAMYNLADSEGNDKVKAVSLVMQSYGFLMLTDLYGNIPFTEAGQGDINGNLTPAYNTQQEVYEGVFAMLDNAMTLIDGSGTIDTTNDLIYQGNASNWKKFAASLKFRAVMRVSGKYTASEVSNWLTPLVSTVFSSKAEEAKLIYLATSPSANPMFETIVEGTRDEYRLCKTLTDIMNTTSDPRLGAFAEPNDNGNYEGKPAGYLTIPAAYSGGLVSQIGAATYLDPTSPGYFLSFTQIQFLMAEAAHKGFIGGSAATYYANAITASFADNGVSGAAGYISSNPYTNDVAGLHRIALEEWIALYGQGFEAWTEWRRNKQPMLLPAIDGQYNEVPSRLTYPTTEQSINASNYQAALAIQGADALTTPIWWMN